MPAKQEKQNEPKAIGEKPEAKKEEDLSFLQYVGKLGYPFADVIGKVVIIERREPELFSIGIQDLNERKEIVLTASREKWISIAEDILAELKGK